jgi:hypothetical protein
LYRLSDGTVSREYNLKLRSLMPFFNETNLNQSDLITQDALLVTEINSDISTPLTPIESESETSILYTKLVSSDRHEDRYHNVFRKIAKNISKYSNGTSQFENTDQLLERLSELAQDGMQKINPTHIRSKLHKEVKPFKDYFPLHTNCKLTLYHDAHGSLDGSNVFEDIHNSILNAQQIIYITGWSVNTSMRLKRTSEDEYSQLTLGELLKLKAQEGVTVCIILWNETGSRLQSNMGTLDTESVSYFENSKVKACLSRRDGYLGLLFTHHQKTIIVDAPSKGDPNRRTVVAYVGGLDLTSGRYDTPDHYIFSTLQTVHAQDIYCNRALVKREFGPRLPWHDSK